VTKKTVLALRRYVVQGKQREGEKAISGGKGGAKRPYGSVVQSEEGSEPAALTRLPGFR